MDPNRHSQPRGLRASKSAPIGTRLIPIWSGVGKYFAYFLRKKTACGTFLRRMLSPTAHAMDQLSTSPTAAQSLKRRFYTEREAADYLGISLRMLQQRRRKCKIDATRVGRYHVQYVQEQLDAYVAKCATSGEQGSSVKHTTHRRSQRMKKIPEPMEERRKERRIGPHYAGSMFRDIFRMMEAGSVGQSNVTKPDN